MNWDHVVSAATRPPWVDSLATTVQGLVGRVYEAAGPAGQQVQNVLHGTWLGHPIHPLMTQVPVGTWKIALTFAVLDAAAREVRGRAARGRVGRGRDVPGRGRGYTRLARPA